MPRLTPLKLGKRAWGKGHKDIKGNEEADRLCKRALGHESEGVVIPAGLRAWLRRVRGQRGVRKRRAGLGEKGPVSIHLVPDGQRAAERVAIQNRQGGYRQLQVWGGNDGHTRGGGQSWSNGAHGGQSGESEGLPPGRSLR